MERFYKELIENSDQLSFDNIYSTRAGTYLELHANRTVWKLEKGISDDLYVNLVHEKVLKFEKETGVDIYLLGRSGRHVCVELNATNLERYTQLKEKALELEEELINEINNMETE